MESSPASAEVKGSMQAEEKEREGERQRKQKKTETEWRGRGGHQSQTTTREGEHAEQINKVQKKHRCWLEALGEADLYLPTLLPLEALLSLTAWRPGKLTAGQKGRSPSSRHCTGGEKKH